jgi:hypothetical protein
MVSLVQARCGSTRISISVAYKPSHTLPVHRDEGLSFQLSQLEGNLKVFWLQPFHTEIFIPARAPPMFGAITVLISEEIYPGSAVAKLRPFFLGHLKCTLDNLVDNLEPCTRNPDIVDTAIVGASFLRSIAWRLDSMTHLISCLFLWGVGQPPIYYPLSCVLGYSN